MNNKAGKPRIQYNQTQSVSHLILKAFLNRNLLLVFQGTKEPARALHGACAKWKRKICDEFTAKAQEQGPFLNIRRHKGE